MKRVGIAVVLIATATWADGSLYSERIKAHALDPQFLCELRLSDYGQNRRFVVAYLAGQACSTDPAYPKTACLELATRIGDEPIRYLNADDARDLRRSCALAQRLNRAEWPLGNGRISDGVHPYAYVSSSVTCTGERPSGLRIEGGADQDNRQVVTCPLPAYFQQ